MHFQKNFLIVVCAVACSMITRSFPNCHTVTVRLQFLNFGLASKSDKRSRSLLPGGGCTLYLDVFANDVKSRELTIKSGAASREQVYLPVRRRASQRTHSHVKRDVAILLLQALFHEKKRLDC